ncbi:hypothetical protein GCM10028777_18530 [Angustibacter speluncae]
MHLPTEFSDVPKRHRDVAFLAAKRARLREEHVRPVNDFVDVIRDEIAVERGVAPATVNVPYIDPDSGGVAARVLLVLESPAGPAALGSGMLSADNDDETAKNVWHAYRASGLSRTAGLHWNAVPWYVGTEKRNAPVTTADVTRGREFLVRLLDLATEVRVVIALGKRAQAGLGPLSSTLEDRRIHLLHCIHPGPQNYNSPSRDARAKVHETFRAARELLG